MVTAEVPRRARDGERREPTAPTGLLLQLIEAATLAPSSHNTQPWLFREIPDGVELCADRPRALPVNDPHDRELTVSCGAALFNLRTAAAAAGLAVDVELLPDANDPDLLARLRFSGAEEPPAGDVLLHSARHQRHTWRRPFRERVVDESDVCRLSAAAEREGAELRRVGDAQRGPLAALVEEGDRQQFGSLQWRRELASWMRTRRHGDGLPLAAVVLPLTRLILAAANLGQSRGRKDAALLRQAPLVALLGTGTDRPLDWLRCGQALERMLLTAAAVGLSAGYLNQPCQVGGWLRSEVATVLDYTGHPQLLVLIGYPSSSPVPAPRRPVADVVLPSTPPASLP